MVGGFKIALTIADKENQDNPIDSFAIPFSLCLISLSLLRLKLIQNKMQHLGDDLENKDISLDQYKENSLSALKKSKTMSNYNFASSFFALYPIYFCILDFQDKDNIAEKITYFILFNLVVCEKIYWCNH